MLDHRSSLTYKPIIRYNDSTYITKHNTIVNRQAIQNDALEVRRLLAVGGPAAQPVEAIAVVEERVRLRDVGVATRTARVQHASTARRGLVDGLKRGVELLGRRLEALQVEAITIAKVGEDARHEPVPAPVRITRRQVARPQPDGSVLPLPELPEALGRDAEHHRNTRDADATRQRPPNQRA